MGAYQTFANANVSSLQNQITGANTNIQTTSANLGAFQAYANSKIGTNTNSNLVVASTDKSISQFTGALVVAGGVGVNGNINVSSSAGNSIITSGAIISTANATVDIGSSSIYWRNLYARTQNSDTVTVGGGGLTSAGNIVAASSQTSSNVATGALVVVGGAGISGNLNITNTGDVSANIGVLFNGNASTNANIGAFYAYANANLATRTTNFTTLDANVGLLFSGNASTNANLGAYQTYANANIGAFYAYANAKIGSLGGTSVVINGTNGNLLVGYSSVTTTTAGGNFAVAGNVGIGKSDPIAKFQVYTTNAIQTYFGASNAGTTPIQNQIMTQAKSSGGTGLEVYDQNGADATITPFVVSNNSGPSVSKVNLLKVDGTGNVSINGTLWLQNVGDLSANLGAVSLAAGTGASAFYTYANTKIGTNSGSNVGIGTNNPSKKLEVYAALNSLQILSTVRNDNTGTGTAAIGFNVTGAASSETSSSKAGIGFTRQSPYGVGALSFYNNNTGSAGDFTATDERMQIASNSMVIVTSTTASTSNVTGALVVKGGIASNGGLTIEGGQVNYNNNYANTDPASYDARQFMAMTNWTNIPGVSYSGADQRVFAMGLGPSNRFFLRTSANPIELNAGNVFVSGGGMAVAGSIIPTANLSYNLGSTTAWWSSIYGKAVQAQYADLAERYVSDADYPPGTVVVIGGTAEVTVTTIDHDPRAAGVVSTDPAYLMNAASTGLPIALTGRVPCRVVGPVNKGSLLVTSTTSGVAQVMDPARYQPGCVIGKSLQTIADDGIHVIEIMVGRY